MELQARSEPVDEQEQWCESVLGDASTSDQGAEIVMARDKKTGLEMIGKCLMKGESRILQYMGRSGVAKRSPFQTTIITMGETGVGKSSVINHLLNAEMAETGDLESMTRSVTEYTASVCIEELYTVGIKLALVDTPGFNDTKGLKQDAFNLATISKFCGQRNEAYPNCILFCIKADDNRLGGANSQFMRNLKLLNHIGVIDSERPNLIVVITHACSVGFANVGKWEESLRKKTEKIQEILESCIKFRPKVICLENDPESHGLKVDETLSKLPNGTLQPFNLFSAIMDMMEQNGDELGLATVREFYRRSDNQLNFEEGESFYATDASAPESKLDKLEKLCAEILLATSGVNELLEEISRTNEAKDKKVKQAVDKIKSEFLQFLSSSQEEETTEEQTEPTGQNPEPPLPEELGSRRAQAESRPLPPQSRDLKDVVILALAVVGVVSLASLGVVLATISAGAAIGVTASAGTAGAFLVTAYKCAEQSTPD